MQQAGVIQAVKQHAA